MYVQELLSDSGIGREMHVIVGQGRLAAILESRPEDRRAFIEEAAGVLKHRKRKEKAVRKLDAMQANLARLNDLTAVVVAVTVSLDLALAGVRFVWSPVDFRWPRPSTPVAVVVLFGVAVVYLTLSWSLAGRTYGARLLGLRLLSGRYRPVGLVRSLLRAIACVLFPLGLLWSGISATRRSLQDIVLRTVVVYDLRSTVEMRVPVPRPAVGEDMPGTSPPPAQPSKPQPSKPQPSKPQPSETEPSRP